MPDIRKIARAHMKAIVDHLGCFDAVAETINTRWGEGASKGTVSKKVSGSLDWTIADVVALEDASGRYPVTRTLARRLEAAGQVADCNLVEHSGVIAKESGEAIAAILAAQQSSCADQRADAVCEIEQAIQALNVARRRLEAGRDRG